MPIAFDRSTCCDLNETISREWLVTNGLGGYAAGTVAGVLTRMQHGLLVASSKDTAAPQLLLAKIDEELVFDERKYYLGTNEYRDGTLNPAGFVHLETFRLEEGFPVFTYHLGGIDGIVLEKRIWMPRGYNTTYIQYRLLRTTEAGGTNEYSRWSRNIEPHPATEFGRNNDYAAYQAYPEAAQRILSLTLLPFSAYRRYDQPQYGNNDWLFQVQVHSNARRQLSGGDDKLEVEEENILPLPKGVTGCTIRAGEDSPPYSIFAVGHPDSQVTFIPTGVWYWHFLRRHDQAAGRPAVDDLYLPGVIKAKLWPGEDSVLTIIATAEELSSQTFNPAQLKLSYTRSVAAQKELVNSVLQPQRYFGEGGETTHFPQLLSLPPAADSTIDSEEYLRLLLQAAEHFLVERVVPRNEQADIQSLFSRDQETTPVILSNYFDQEDSTRDALIALPGLTLTTNRFDEARSILRCYARYFKQGMLPERLPSTKRPLTEHDYGSADTTLWYFYALDQYARATHDYQLLDELYLRLAESIDWHIQGTYNAIQVDASDGLLRADQPGKALTWMNATTDDKPRTPRRGKAVEVNALWYHALSLMREWSLRLEQMGSPSNIHSSSFYHKQAAHCKEHFQQRFWHASGGYLYDVIDGPEGDDGSLRPNQLLAFSLRHKVLDDERQHAVFERVTQRLLTPLGLRTLAPAKQEFSKKLEEEREERDQSLEQESIHPWLIGPYIDAMLALQDARPATLATRKTNQGWRQDGLWQRNLSLLVPFREQLNQGLLGMIGEFSASTVVQHEEYHVASVRSTAELLRVYHLFAHRQQSSQPSSMVGSGTVPMSKIASTRTQVGNTSLINATKRGLNGI
jgi:glycogen debranching enzyme